MMVLTTKIKILVSVALCAIAVFAFYWIFMRVRRGGVGSSSAVFLASHEQVRKEILPNGMHVLVFKNSSLPKVLVQIAYDVGSYVEESGERGLAHLIEHMIFKGTTTLSESDIDAIARKYGASFNAFTSLDQTSYYFEANKNNWKPFVAILADCMQNASFDAQHLASEVKAVVQELKMGKDNYWRAMMMKAMELIFPANHPYHTPPIGFKEDLLNLNADNLTKFYEKYYRPDRATLFIVGDVDMDEALDLARQQFAGIKPSQRSVVKQFPTILPELVTHHTRYFEDVTTQRLGFFWMIPGFKSHDELVASMLEGILGGGESGRLYHLLVDQKQVASSVQVSAAKFMEAGIFLVLIEPVQGKTDECAKLVRDELDRLIKDGVTQLELESVAKNKSVDFFHKMQNFTDFVYSWIQSYFATRHEMDIFERVNRYAQIKSSQVQDYARTYLDPFLMNTIEVLPLPESKRSMREAIKRLSEELDQKILSLHVRTAPVQEPHAVYNYPAPTPLTFVFPKPARILELPNGLKVLLAPNQNVPLVTLNCQFIRADFLEEARDGIDVGFMMEMLIEGSIGFTKKENVDFFQQHGASYNFDKQGARLICLTQDFEKVAVRFEHILRQPTWPVDALDKLKNIFVDAYHRAKDSPQALAMRILKNAIYKDHPFAWTYDQAIEQVEQCDQAVLQALHESFVCPANMIVSVVGAFDVEAMVQFIQTMCQQWPVGTKKLFPKAPQSFEKNVHIDHYMLRDQVMFLLGRPSPLTVYDADLVPLKLLNIIAFGSMGSRIFKLREQTGLFYTAFGAFASNAAREHGFDFVGMLVSLENVDKAEQLTRALLDQLVQGGVTEEEVDAARQIYLKALIDLVDDNTAIARLLCSLDSLELGFDYYENVLSRVQSLSVAQINEIAAKYCSPDGMARVRVGPIQGSPQVVQLLHGA